MFFVPKQVKASKIKGEILIGFFKVYLISESCMSGCPRKKKNEKKILDKLQNPSFNFLNIKIYSVTSAI